MSDQSTTHGTINTTSSEYERETSMLSAGPEPAIPASKQLQTYAIDNTAIGIH